MAWLFALLAISVVLAAAVCVWILEPLYSSPLASIPGPTLYAFTKWRLAWDEWKGQRMQTVQRLHLRYGPIVRIGPNEVHLNSSSALRTIYGPGSGFERTDFYRMFDVYGKQNVFTFGPSQAHAARKKLLANVYSKSNIMRSSVADVIERKVEDYMKLIESTRAQRNDIFTSLHWYSLDNITAFLYGPDHGGTAALKGNGTHQELLNDILDPSRRRLSWFVVHLPALTKWLYTRTGWTERLIAPCLPMQKPATYTRIREHALKAMREFSLVVKNGNLTHSSQDAVIARLWSHHKDSKSGGLSDLDIASECSDHFLAGIDTTSDTLMFLIWVLSLPQNRRHQERLIEEACSIPVSGLNEDGNPSVATADKLPYLDAIVKETLRLYAPIPASEPRQPPQDTEIDGYHIPAWTIVSMAPYSLHRNKDIFLHPLGWDPERWLGNSAEVTEMKRWWWAFSSGARMCIGMHLALAEMALVPAIYRKYSTRITPGFEGITPGITSRFEVFYDETFSKMEVSQSFRTLAV